MISLRDMPCALLMAVSLALGVCCLFKPSVQHAKVPDTPSALPAMAPIHPPAMAALPRLAILPAPYTVSVMQGESLGQLRMGSRCVSFSRQPEDGVVRQKACGTL